MVDAMCELAKIFRPLDRKVCHGTDATPYEVSLHHEIRDYFTKIASDEADRIVSSHSKTAVLRRFLKGVEKKNGLPAGYVFPMDNGGHWFTDNHLAVITYTDISGYRQKESYDGIVPDVFRVFPSDTRYDDYAYVSLFNLCAHEVVYPVDPENV